MGFFKMGGPNKYSELKRQETLDKVLGKTFNDWTVTGKTIDTERQIMARCVCGVERPVKYQALLGGTSKGCGCKRFERTKKTTKERYGFDFPGQSPKSIAALKERSAISEQKWIEENHGKRFNSFIVIANELIRKDSRILVLVRCDCGIEKEQNIYKLRDGIAKSCGCQRSKNLKETFQEKYGVDNASQLEHVKADRKEKMPKILEKMKFTNLQNWGSENPSGHPEIKKRRAATTKERFGVEHYSHDPKLALEIAKANKLTQILTHWKTGEDLVCTASYEITTVNYLNKNKIEFLWQPKTFPLNNGTTYRPDLYLVNEDKWVEIKGYWRPRAIIKWQLFQEFMPNSEVWDEKKINELKKLL